MSLSITIRNRQKTRVLNTSLLRQIIRSLLSDEFRLSGCELCFHFVAAPEMARINKAFLNHEGSTDVITFDHSSPSAGATGQPTCFHGEIFICIDDAVKQSRQFRTVWQSELVRYVIHGLLHLAGHDDLRPAARRKMKREENRLLRLLAKRFAFGKLAA